MQEYLKSPVSGTAMGLIKEGEEIRIPLIFKELKISWRYGFKVAGTEKGITAPNGYEDNWLTSSYYF